MKVLKEAKDLTLYKELLTKLGDYCERNPATGVDSMLEKLIDGGVKIIPKDDRAQLILFKILYQFDDGEICSPIHQLLNYRFGDLPIEQRPIFKNGRRHETAFWMSNGVINDNIRSLFNWSGGKQGFWCNVDGEKVTLINTGD